ncbi:DUF6765 family protein [Magnetospira sp. QH-2]|uniref:DUF6765 family protein n=1 Tax=Magnetospira sp. (strain QH-2) TaxID=1288970 RepID=UPI0003E80F59|nr:DUF6765 family protein [Magnetospira sp. QH-2]CCQ75678.1 conserved protein of unknown function [Magnetospira sp. QH-2]
MKIDMHFYGTYAMARTAGLTQEAARTIAYASQFVDDSAAHEANHTQLSDGAHIVSEVTAHHSVQAVLDYFESKLDHDDEDQRLIWVPFHFLPGGAGIDWTERLVCTKNSKIAQQMVAHHLAHAKSDYALELMGIMAHVYADTFAHYGFSGVSSRRNEVDGDSIRVLRGTDPMEPTEKSGWKARFGKLLKFRNIRAGINDLIEDATGALGHGGVMVYPDIPYIEWTYKAEQSGNTQTRDNLEDFMEACRELHGRFRSFADGCDPSFQDRAARAEFAGMEPKIREILSFEGDTEQRIVQWRQALSDGSLFAPIQDHVARYRPMNWIGQIEDLKAANSSASVSEANIYRFYQAARLHRTFVLRDLLPSHGIVVI